MTVQRSKSPTKKHLRHSIIAAALWALSAPVSALSLSEIDLHSGLHQPFHASILLRNFDSVEIDRISVEIADDVMQAQYNGSTYLPAPLKASLRTTKSGTYIDLKTPHAVDEPFLKFAVQLNSPEGMILRQYEVLIDPPKTLYKQTPSPVVQQLASRTAPATVRKIKESIQTSAQDQANGIELVTPKTSALKKAPTMAKPRASQEAAPVIRTALPAPAATSNTPLAQKELPLVTALIDKAQANDIPAAEEKLFNTTEMSTEEFLASLDEYSLTKVLTPVRKQKAEQQSSVSLQQSTQPDPSISSAIPETAALVEQPKKTQLQVDSTATQAQQAIPVGRIMGSKSARFAVDANDFEGNDADSVARALMNYRDRARTGQKTEGQLNKLMHLSASGVKRVPQASSPEQLSE